MRSDVRLFLGWGCGKHTDSLDCNIPEGKAFQG
eukprot:CAMPEP_0184338056 /NCGR_PEP_ID=MMETSP1089-20130417/6572_1 /TAXON_ID=38269 ORGANISM="Gloeochaete wittrockiana, Strain SAG46.84" /NCGR_SAMPLE_ID=MMETSP1089 /ASSEMBLY_ACC=CAM_ASM_000445 /LENGTH=32 /DNA_ID= /DNA_START= /DNA_END= /DNA_ORIENTATION=